MKTKPYLIGFALLLFSFTATSQGVHLVGASLQIDAGTAVSIHGLNLRMAEHSTTPGQIRTAGLLGLTGNFANQNSVGPFINPSTNQGTLNLYGEGSTEISGTSTLALYRLIIDKATGGVTLSSPALIHGELGLTKGIITNSSHPITLEAGATATGGNTLSHVNGQMKKKGTAADNAFIFPLGTGAHFRPAGFSGLGATRTITAQHFEDDPAAGWVTEPVEGNTVNNTTISHYSKVEYWQVYPDTETSLKIWLSWDNEYCQYSGNPDSLLVAMWNGSAWSNLGAASIDPVGMMVESFSTTSTFNAFTLASTRPPFALGDVNNDYVVNVLDVVWMVSHLTGNTPEGFDESLANVNGEGGIDIADLTALINLILGITKESPLQSEIAYLHLDHEGGIHLESDGTLAAIQFQLIGQREAIDLVNLTEGLQLATYQRGDTLTGILYSLTNRPIPMGSMEILRANMHAEGLVWGKALAANTHAQLVEVVTSLDPAEQAQLSVLLYPNPNPGHFSIRILTPWNALVGARLYDLTGRVVMDIPEQSIQSGAHILPVNCHSSLANGFYMLRMRVRDANNGDLRLIHEEKVLIVR